VQSEQKMDSKLQVQLEKDGGVRTRQSWIETSSQWPCCTESAI